MKKKYFTYILLVVVSLFMFDNSVEAKKVKPSKTKGLGYTCDQIDFDNYEVFDTKGYDVSCIHAFDTDDGNCVIFQFSYDYDYEKKVASNFKFKSLSNSWSDGKHSVKLTNKIDKDKLSGKCSRAVGYFRDLDAKPIVEYISLSTSNATREALMRRKIEPSSSDDVPSKIGSGDAKFDVLDCEQIIAGENNDLLDILQGIVDIVKVFVPIALIVLGVLDFGRAVFSFDEGEMKKAQTKFIKRLIIGMAFFLIPTFLGFILNIAHEIWPDIIKNTLCGIKF